MIDITVDNKGFCLDGRRLLYNLYYFDSEMYEAPTPAETFRKILVRWGILFREQNLCDGTIYLPYAPDDQWTDCLEVDTSGECVSVKTVRVDVSGYQIDIEKIENFVTSTPVIVGYISPAFGVYDKEDFISALINAQVVFE